MQKLHFSYVKSEKLKVIYSVFLKKRLLAPQTQMSFFESMHHAQIATIWVDVGFLLAIHLR